VTQYIHQDPYGAIDSLETVREILDRPLRFLLGIRDTNRKNELLSEALISSGLNEEYLDKKGNDLSGGEKQRILIARAFIVKPKYVVVDEPTTMIDFIHRDEIIETLRNEGNQYGATLMLITHDIMVVPKIAQKVAVLYRGKIIEVGGTREILKNPLHPYTTFLASIKPEKLMGNAKLMDILENYGKNKQNMVVSDKGCAYASMCPLADNNCRTNDPPTIEAVSNHYVKCFKPGEFQL
jgi:peptide/nickel transport system ATP-binding protein